MQKIDYFWLIATVLILLLVAGKLVRGEILNGPDRVWGALSLIYIAATVFSFLKGKKNVKTD